MDITKAVRNPAKVHQDLKKVDGKLVTKGGCWIYIPVSYSSKDLAFITSSVTILGVFLITTDNKTYGASGATSLMNINPSAIEVIDINGEEYYQFYFEPGSVVVSNVNLKCVKKLTYNIMSQFFDYGRVPFWFTPIDHASLLANVRYWNDMTVFPDGITHDIYSAHLQRNTNDVRKFYRHSIKKESDLHQPAIYIPLRAATLTKTSRLAKLADTELKRGIRNALLNDPVREEPLEALLMR